MTIKLSVTYVSLINDRSSICHKSSVKIACFCSSVCWVDIYDPLSFSLENSLVDPSECSPQDSHEEKQFKLPSDPAPSSVKQP